MTVRSIISMAKKFTLWGLLAIVVLSLNARVASADTAVAPSVTWTENLSGALARSGNELKPVLVVFSSPDCPWCVRLRTETLAEQEVLAVLEGFICVAIDTSRDPKTAQEFQIRGVPMTAILSGDGRLQALGEGYMDKTAFLRFIDDYRKGGGKRDTTPPELDKWLKALQAHDVKAIQWPEMMAGLGVKECRIRLHKGLLAYEPCPCREWVELLKHSQLSVRLGTLEILEELAGTTYGYDPWLDSDMNGVSLERWRNWAVGGSNAMPNVFAPLTEEQIFGYIRDLASGERDRSARAVRMLEQGGESVIPVLESWAGTTTGVGEDALRRVKEVRYYLLLPETLGTERARIVHRLVFGNQDERLRSLAAAAAAGERAMPVLAEFLSDADPLIREVAVDSLITAGKNSAYKYLSELLKTEKDEEVIHAVIRGSGSLKGPKAVELVGPFLTNANEDLAVAALASLARTRSSSAANAVRECLKSPRWRVRAAALEAIGKLCSSSAESEAEVTACLEDGDPFIRRTAVLTLSSMSGNRSAKRLAEVFLKDDQLKGPVVVALREMNKPIPETFGPALKGKEVDVLLPVLEGLGNGSGDSWRLALPYVRHANSDVACAAIGVVARGGAKNSEAQAELAKVLHDGVRERVRAVLESYQLDENRHQYSSSISSDSEDFEQLVGPSSVANGGGGVLDTLAGLFSAFSTAAPTSAVTHVATNAVVEPVNLQDVFGAFGPATEVVPAPVAGVTNEVPVKGGGDLFREALVYLDPKWDGDLRFSAAVMLMAMGKGTGVTYLLETIDSRTAEERLMLAQRALQCRGTLIFPLVKRLLRDPSVDVRSMAVALCLQDSAGEAAITELIDAAFAPGTVMNPADLFKEPYQWYQAIRRASVRRMIGTAARQVLENTDGQRYNDPHRILALTLLEVCWREGDGPIIARYLADENPFVRRAAWYAFGKHQPAEFQKKIQSVAKDTSEWVRAVVPVIYGREGASDWTVYFDADHAVGGINSFSSSSGTRKRLATPVVEVLTALSGDPVLSVRCAAAISLFANREKVDLRMLTAVIDGTPEKRMIAYRLSSLLQEMPLSWLRELNVGEVLALMDAVTAQVGGDENRFESLRKQLLAGNEIPAKAVKVVLRKHDPKGPLAVGEGGVPLVSTSGVPSQVMGSEAQRLVVFFRNPGCRDCARVAELLKALRSEFNDMVIEELDIRNPEHARINEVLCDHFEVPDRYRLTAPAIFCGAGNLIKGEITFERLGRMLSRAETKETGWRQVSDEGLVRANQALGERYSAMGMGIVFGAGLLDGINPCAFATIIFLLSYLQVTRRGPREILAVGGAFVVGIFVAYFLLGLGLVEVVVRLSLLRRLGVFLNWGMAAFVAAVALLSVWDGVQCLRGRMGDMVLQLPGVLKARIHDAVRHSTRHRHFVMAAFVAGLAIAVLELACTGQVYAPTILYMLKTGQGRVGAVAYLALYNLAFIVPLLVVFAGAYGGLRSERLAVWLQARAALVKFATAILFAALFVLFVLSSLSA